MWGMSTAYSKCSIFLGTTILISSGTIVPVAAKLAFCAAKKFAKVKMIYLYLLGSTGALSARPRTVMETKMLAKFFVRRGKIFIYRSKNLVRGVLRNLEGKVSQQKLLVKNDGWK